MKCLHITGTLHPQLPNDNWRIPRFTAEIIPAATLASRNNAVRPCGAQPPRPGLRLLPLSSRACRHQEHPRSGAPTGKDDDVGSVNKVLALALS